MRADLTKKVRNLQRKTGIPLLFITHNLEEAMLLADRILILDRGKTQQFGTPEEILNQFKNLHMSGLVTLL
jgi:molybdate transport system ATP-binding protein